MTPQTLIEKAHQAGTQLYANDLTFGVYPDPGFTDEDGIVRTTLAAVVAQFMDDTGGEDGPAVFSTFDYVFFPISGKPPMDVADTVTFDDPRVYDTDGKSYCYSGEASAIYVMDRNGEEA